MKNFKLTPPLSRPLFRFGENRHDKTRLSTHTSWTILTKTTTACIYEPDPKD